MKLNANTTLPKVSLTALLFSGALIAGALPSAHAFEKVGAGSELFATLTADVQYNDNLFLSNSDTKSDTQFDIAPGLDFEFGQGTSTTGKISYAEDFQEFATNSGIDTNLALVDFEAHYTDGQSKIDALGWFHQADQATRDIRSTATLIERDLSHFSLNGEDPITAKTSLGLGASYDDTDFRPAGFRNWQLIQIPANYYFHVEPKLDLSAGFTYQNNQISGNGISSNEYFYNVGARGELTPKLTGQINVGYVDFVPDRGSSQNSLGLQSQFSYALDPKTNILFSALNQYGYSALGDSYRQDGVLGGVQIASSAELSFAAQAFYYHYSYTVTTQRDNYAGGQLTATYKVNDYLNLTAGYTNGHNSSNIKAYTFSSNIFSITAVFRY